MLGGVLIYKQVITGEVEIIKEIHYYKKPTPPFNRWGFFIIFFEYEKDYFYCNDVIEFGG